MTLLDYIFITVCFVWVVTEMILQFTRRPEDTSKDRSSFLVLMITNYLCFLIIFFPILLTHLNRMAIEEKVLKDHFGKEYLDYAAKTKRLIPYIY